MSRRSLLVALCLAVAAGLGAACREPLEDDAYERTVRTYLDHLARAYRMGDSTVLEGLVGDTEGRRVLGLIGVRLDRGVTLDSELLSLEIRQVSTLPDGDVEVRTMERWHYVERWIGNGLPVEEGSEDLYEMSYLLRANGDRWVVQETSFAAKPEVGNELDAWAEGQPFSHGIAEEPKE